MTKIIICLFITVGTLTFIVSDAPSIYGQTYSDTGYGDYPCPRCGKYTPYTPTSHPAYCKWCGAPLFGSSESSNSSENYENSYISYVLRNKILGLDIFDVQSDLQTSRNDEMVARRSMEEWKEAAESSSKLLAQRKSALSKKDSKDREEISNEMDRNRKLLSRLSALQKLLEGLTVDTASLVPGTEIRFLCAPRLDDEMISKGINPVFFVNPSICKQFFRYRDILRKRIEENTKLMHQFYWDIDIQQRDMLYARINKIQLFRDFGSIALKMLTDPMAELEKYGFPPEKLKQLNEAFISANLIFSEVGTIAAPNDKEAKDKVRDCLKHMINAGIVLKSGKSSPELEKINNAAWGLLKLDADSKGLIFQDDKKVMKVIEDKLDMGGIFYRPIYIVSGFVGLTRLREDYVDLSYQSEYIEKTMGRDLDCLKLTRRLLSDDQSYMDEVERMIGLCDYAKCGVEETTK
ncbi:MAG: hypothetical protein PHC37_02140 [Candidatus Omnitrophica bacterium]|nr:hypothetical protein [Candidatus Omnitrophota bacterium]MDD5690487.1 hypothetical protein [Candidatus Omnitrophota bacterium]